LVAILPLLSHLEVHREVGHPTLAYFCELVASAGRHGRHPATQSFLLLTAVKEGAGYEGGYAGTLLRGATETHVHCQDRSPSAKYAIDH